MRAVLVFLIQRRLPAAIGVGLLVVSFLASLLLHRPSLFTLPLPVGIGLVMAQGVGSSLWLARLRPGRRLLPAWAIWANGAAALFFWLVVAWLVWLRAT